MSPWFIKIETEFYLESDIASTSSYNNSKHETWIN